MKPIYPKCGPTQQSEEPNRFFRRYNIENLAGEMIENTTRAGEIGEEFFFGAEFGGMGDEAAAGAARGMLDVEHFVVEDVFDGNLRDAGMIHAAI